MNGDLILEKVTDTNAHTYEEEDTCHMRRRTHNREGDRHKHTHDLIIEKATAYKVYLIMRRRIHVI